MSSLENLINKIISDGNEKAEEIVKNANLQKDQIIKDAKANSEKFLKDSKVNAESEAVNMKNQYLLEQDISLRDKLLAKKQDVLENIFKSSIDKLSNLSTQDYENFLKKYLLILDLDGDEEILIPKKYENINLNSINEHLKSNGKKGELTISSTKKELKNGFIAAKGGIENDNTFEALVNYFRDDLEKELIKIFE